MKRFAIGLASAASLGFVTFAAAQTTTTTYTYDAKGRLIAAGYSNGWTTSYSYDAVDNRTRLVMSTAGYIGSSAPPVTVFAGAPVEIDVASVSRNPEAASKTLTAVEGAKKGEVSIGPNGRVIYTPKPGARGRDTFTYTLTDGAVTDKASIRVDIKAVAASRRSSSQR